MLNVTALSTAGLGADDEKDILLDNWAAEIRTQIFFYKNKEYIMIKNKQTKNMTLKEIHDNASY